MNSSTPDAARPLLEVRGARASSVIVQRIPPDAAEAFLEWQRGIAAAAAEFPGYQTTEIYPPLAHQEEWVVIVHFDDPKTLQAWLESPARAEWTAKLPAGVADFKLKTLSAGLSPWFAGLITDGAAFPHWKVWLAVLLCLYPIVMLITIFVSPYTTRLFGMALAMLIGNAVSVAIIEWGTPVYRYVLGWWFRAHGKEGRALSFVGLVLIVGTLALMTFVFSLMTG